MNELQGFAADIRNVEDRFQEECGDDPDNKFDDLLDASTTDDTIQLVQVCLNAEEPEDKFAHSVVRRAYEQQATQYERRKRVRELVVSLITKGGALVDDTQWELIDQLALGEYVEPPADLFIWESRDGQTITILTLMETEEPTSVYERLTDLLVEIKSHKVEISDELGKHRGDDTPLDINDSGIEGAILIARPPGNSNEYLREEIPETLASAQGGDPISIWDFEPTADEQLTILSEMSVGQIDDWNWHVPDNSLGELLEGGKRFSHLFQASVTHFPDSHHEQVFRGIPTHLHRRNQTQRRDENGDPLNERTRQKWVFSRTEFVDYFVPEDSTMTQADVEHRIDPLLSWWADLEVISQKTSGYEPYYDDGDDGDDNDDTGDEIYKFEQLNTASKTPDGFWTEAVEPYRDAVATKLLEAHVKLRGIPEETREEMDIAPIIENPLECADEEAIEEAITDLDTSAS